MYAQIRGGFTLMHKKRFIAILSALAIVMVLTVNTSAAEIASPVFSESQEASLSAVDSFSFVWSFQSSQQTFLKGGTFYIALESSNASANGTYKVELLDSSGNVTAHGTANVPMNGTCTVNFVNQSAGIHYFKFSKTDGTNSIQQVTVLAVGVA